MWRHTFTSRKLAVCVTTARPSLQVNQVLQSTVADPANGSETRAFRQAVSTGSAQAMNVIEPAARQGFSIDTALSRSLSTCLEPVEGCLRVSKPGRLPAHSALRCRQALQGRPYGSLDMGVANYQFALRSAGQRV